MTFPTSLALRADLDKTGSIANVAYNGFRFPLGRHSTISFSPEMSDDGRTVKYLRADLRIEFVWIPMDYLDSSSFPTGNGFDPAGTTDEDFPAIRQRLTAIGQPLRFWAQGIGNFSTQEFSRMDVNGGPRPKIVSERPIAGSKAMVITWECSTWVPNCLSNNGTVGIAQFPYTISWGIGPNGMTTRTITGLAEIPLSRNPNPGGVNASPYTRDTADRIREDMVNVFPLLEGFERSQNYTLSQDRKTINFTITDTEIASDNPYFPGIVRINAPIRYSSDYKSGFTRWSGTVSATIEVAPGYSKLRGWLSYLYIFDDIFKRRGRGHLPKVASTDSSTPEDQNGDVSRGFISSISLEEDKYTRTLSFSIGYVLFCSLNELFKATGFMQPYEDGGLAANFSNWSLWKQSIGFIQSARGWRGLRHFTSDDVILDLCSDAQAFPQVAQGAQEPQYTPEQDPTRDGEKPKQNVKQEESHVAYSHQLKMTIKDGLSYARPLQKSNAIQETLDLVRRDTKTITEFGTEETNSGVTPKKIVTHRSTPTTYIVEFSGYSARVCYEPIVPNLKSIGGIKAVKYGDDEITKVPIGSGCDPETGLPIAISGVSWVKRYILEDRPADGKIECDAGSIA